MSGNGASPVQVVPDVGGQELMVDVVHRLLLQSATKRRELEATRVANGHSEDDPVPGYEPTRGDGTVNSYRLILAELHEQEQRLAEAYPEEMKLIAEAVERRRPTPVATSEAA